MTSPQPVSFLSLPREVRDQIYTEVLVKPDPILIFEMHVVPHHPRRSYPGVYLTRFKVCRQIYLEAASIFYGRNQFEFVDSEEPVQHAWAALVAWTEVIGPLSTSYLKKIAMTFPDVGTVVWAGGNIAIPRHIVHLFTTRFDDKTSWHMDDVVQKACKLLVQRGVKLQSFRLYFRYSYVGGYEQWSKCLWALEEIRQNLALPPEKIVFMSNHRIGIPHDFLAQGYKCQVVH